MAMIRKTFIAALALVAGASAAQAQSCDRACLLKLTDNYVAPSVKPAPTAVPLAADLRLVENVTKMKPGEGLWATATGGATAFVLHVPDPINQTAGWLGMIQNKGEPAMVAI